MTRAGWLRAIRETHAYSGLALAATLAMYAITGVALVHSSWLPDSSARTRERVVLEFDRASLASDAGRREVAERAQRELALEGRVKIAPAPDGGATIRFDRPAHRATLTLDPATREAWIERSTLGLATTLGNVHQLHGTRGGAAHLAWAIWLDVAGASLVAFALSGIALWALTRADRLGLALLATSTLACAVAIATLALSR